MKPTRSAYRLTVLALAALLSLAWAVHHYRSRPMAELVAPVTLSRPPILASPRLRDKTSSLNLPAAKKTAIPKRMRGEMLREKGESLFGGTPEPIAVDTGTPAAQ